jgi:hydrogenase maturation protease
VIRDEQGKSVESAAATGGPERTEGRPPVLVLGLGNLLLRDDGVGLELLARLQRVTGQDDRVEFVDGGTQGLALASHLAGRAAVLILDATRLGAAPGTVHSHPDVRTVVGARGDSAHATGAADLLAAAVWLGDCPASVLAVGIEPEDLTTGIGLSPVVAQALPVATVAARRALDEILRGLTAKSA